MNLQGLSLEQLQEIVDGAPDKTADYFIADKNAREYHSLEFGSYFSSELGEWEDSDFRTESELKNIYRNVLKLSDIRAELAMRKIVPNAQSDFVVGDLVVFDDQESPLHPTFKSIFLIDGVYTATVDLNFAGTVNLPKRMMRLATPAEIAVGHRIDETEEELLAEAEVWRECREPCRFDRLEAEPENGWAINPTRNKVCIEQETPELFNSKHCSPRNYNNDSQLRVSEIKASAAYSKMALANFTLSEKNSRLKTNNHALKAALAMAIVAGVVGWML